MSNLERLLSSCADIGGIYSLSYSEAIVLTSDFHKAKHGGIPQGGWLLAAACNRSVDGLDFEDEEVILLRVRATAPLPNERELVAGRVAVVRDSHASDSSYEDVLDVHTRAEHEQSAFACDVVGVFYTDDDSLRVSFGAELSNVWSSARYRVFQPTEEVLSWIASFPRSVDSIPLGVVRFSATRRNAKMHGLDQAPVYVNIEDFIGRRTFAAGTTRSGKSNSIKTICTAIAEYAAIHGQKIGQIIFDPQGEYAKVNEQDGTGLRLLGDPGDDRVRIYTSDPDPSSGQEHPLRLNFYDTDLFDIAWDMVVGSMADAEANYVKTFRSTDMDKPDSTDHSALTHWGRGRMAFYGLLARAGYKGTFTNGATISFSLKDDAAAAFNAAHKAQALSGGSGSYIVSSPQQASAVVAWVNLLLGRMEKLSKSNRDEDHDELEEIMGWVGKWAESDQFVAVADVFKYGKGKGLAELRSLRDFHDPSGRGDIGAMVWEDMTEGRLVIVDLSIGSDTVARVMSERLVTALVGEASKRFRNGDKPIPFQVVVEEAHNLFTRGREARDDPWVKMSKESAKYGIGLLYATQEVTSIDQRILSNTHNWLVSNLFSDIELRELGKYYDFARFGESIKRAEDRGYARVKTLSSPYIVPVQIAKFDHDMINRARTAAGLSAVAPPGQNVGLRSVPREKIW